MVNTTSILGGGASWIVILADPTLTAAIAYVCTTFPGWLYLKIASVKPLKMSNRVIAEIRDMRYELDYLDLLENMARRTMAKKYNILYSD